MFTCFSTGLRGGKVEDLETYAPILREAGFDVPGGWANGQKKVQQLGLRSYELSKAKCCK